jgi:acyl transferase domain-containing protein/thioesterase domain-containing protein/acyl carrier protein
MSCNEPIAIIGIGCRFPGGARGPEAFWKLLCNGVDAISEVPADRWNADTFYDPRPGQKSKSISRWLGVVDSIDRFDAGFFGVSPREAECMDPQQRMLLQAAWEAVDDGGEVLDPLRGSPAGVFVGISTYDYALLQSTPDNQSTIDVYTGTGGAMSIAANRISYCLNLRGPSIAVDTACSSSLVALHLACASLWQGECPLAFVGGVNAIMTVTTFIGFSLNGMLSPDGRCKAFDATANGFVRAEGCGVVLLKPLSAALADGNPIYAVIRGTAANQDGRTNGITLPSAAAQETLVREACRSAGVSPEQVQYVEAHGTGTLVGDPIEASALGAALCEGRGAGRPLVIGSVKTNIGHMEAGAGIAGIIKTALALKHGQIPPSLHFKNPNPHIDFENLKLRVAQQMEPFRNGSESPVAGVNSFGFGGTNAHAILQALPVAAKIRVPPRKLPTDRAHLLSLSARCEESLLGLAEKYTAFLSKGGEGCGLSLDDICFTAGVHRTRHSHRLCVAAGSREEMVEKLQAFVAGEARPGLSTGHVAGEQSPVFLFSGQGPQWWAMGRELLEQEPVFRAKIEECDALLREFGDWSLIGEMKRDESSSRMDQTSIAQPAIFALQVALAALWQSWGIRPAAAVGHSVGEVAAAHLADVLSLRDAARVIFQRGRCMDVAPERGRMLAAALTWEQAEETIAPWAGRVSIAALNGPSSVTLSGDASALEAIGAKLEQRSIFNRFLRVNYAFHSHQMEPVRDELLRSLGRVETHPASLCLFSTVTGAEATNADFAADYWWRNVRMTVRFATAIDALIERGHRTFLEIGPHPALIGSVQECLAQRAVTGAAISSLRRKENEHAMMLGSLGALHTLGCEVRWKALHPAASAVRLPSYAWREEQYWHEAAESRESRLGSSPHPFLARRIRAADPTWHTRLDLNAAPFLKDHLVQEHIVFPAAGYVEMALGAARVLFGEGPSVIEEIDFKKALVLKETDEEARIQLCHHQQDSTFTISSCAGAAEETWTVNSIGKIRACPEAKVPDSSVPESLDIASAQQVGSEVIYGRFRELGLPYGPMFRCIETAWRRDGEVLGRIQLPASLEWESARYQIHPTLLDACFQLLLLAVPAADTVERQTLYLPVQISRVRSFARPGGKLWCHARLVHIGGRAVVGDIRILDEDGRALIDIEGFRCQAVSRGRTDASGGANDLLYEVLWKLRPLTSTGIASAPADMAISMRRIAAQVEGVAKRLRVQTAAECDGNKLTGRLDPLCRFYILDAFRQMGWKLRTGERVSLASLSKRLRVAPRHRQVFARFVSFLEEDGLLSQSGEGWRVRRAVNIPDMDSLWRSTLDEFPGVLAELSLIRSCGRELAAVLRGDIDPLKLIFPEGSLAGAEHLYQDSMSFRGSNLLVAEAVAAVVKQLPEGRTLRVLEIGAGTGGMTSHVLPRLPGDRTDYVFSDLSNGFFSKAEQKFFDFPFVRCQLLDIEKPAQEQGFGPTSFDVILASDAIHATSDLRKTLANVRSLLAPGGLLVFLEVDRLARWPDLVFGLTEGWWRFTDTELRPSYPLLDGGEWLHLLGEMGFVGGRAISDRSSSAKARQAIFLASAPVAPSRNTAPIDLDLHRNGKPVAWLLFADRSGAAGRIATLLGERDDQVVTVRAGREYRRAGDTEFEINPQSPGDMQRLVAEIRACGFHAISGVVHFWSLNSAPPSSLTPELLLNAQAENCYSLLHLVQALTAETFSELPRLFLITRGARAVVRTDTVAVAQGPVHGLAGVIANEYPKFRCRTIDLAPEATEDEARLLFSELFSDDEEDQVALRGSARYASRIARTSADLHARHGSPNAARKSYRVEIDSPGALDHLVLRERAIRRPGPDEVVIEIKAAALNFRDVMKALGIYPGDSDDDALLGDECSGRVTAVGRNVKHLRVGDAVMAVGPGCFASHFTMPAALVLRKPARICFGEAATIPIAFLTAWYALHHLGRIRKGDRVLIQAATGGVGLAAVQLARLAGAEIFGTAGSPEKRDFLRAQGVHHVMDSRSLAFADEVREITGGNGVDLVLNSLAGEAIAAGISTLATGGRFLEIGKRDIYQNSKIGLRPLRNNISFFVIDLAQLMREDPPLVASMLRRLMPMFASGKLHPLPFRVFRASQVVSAFRHMSQARHIGKIVLSMENDHVAPVPRSAVKPMRFRTDASYLITGGLGGFGLAVAEWMLRNGAGHIALASRSGAATDDARRAVASLKKLGGVLVVKADVSSERDVERIFRTIARKLPPLRGILHAAMVLDDGVLAQQTAARFSRVMAPKVSGAWNLHVCSKGLPLDFFVLFSSIATIAGSPGQGGYVAANSFLESLAQHRRAIGLPGLAINWGVISEVGFVARNAKLGDLLEGSGLGGITPAQAVGVLGRLLQGDGAQFGVGRVDWQRLADCFPIIGTSPRYSEVVHARNSDQPKDGQSFREEILSSPATGRLAAVTAQLKEQIAKVLRTSPSKLDTERPLNEHGLDSLMGVELLNRIETSLGVSLPPGNLAAGNSISKMAAQILEAMTGASATPAVEVGEAPRTRVSPSCLVPLRASGSMAPLFCIHPAGGLVNIYENLVRHLPSDLPVYGIQSRALFGDASEHPSVSEMARHYASLIQEKQPRDPVYLLGFSFGGFVALAVARFLEDAGRPVAFVGLIDADLRWTGKDYLKKEFLRRHIIEMYGTFTRELGLLKPLDAQALAEFSTQVAGEINQASPETRIEGVLRSIAAHDYISPGLPDSLLKHYLSLFLSHSDSLGDCAPTVISAPLAMWSGRETRSGSSGWRRYTTGGFSEGVIDGAHYDLMYPPLVDSLAKQLTAVLKRTHSRRTKSERALAPV